jgi:hypothetical protein
MAIALRAPLGADEVIKGRKWIEAGAQPHQVMGGAADRETVLLPKLLQHAPDIAAHLAVQVVAGIGRGGPLMQAVAVGDLPRAGIGLAGHQIASAAPTPPLLPLAASSRSKRSMNSACRL